jgi:Ni/Co efflux regulator RcnB
LHLAGKQTPAAIWSAARWDVDNSQGHQKMKAKTLLSSLVIASMAVGSVSFAQPRRDVDHGRRNEVRQEQRQEERHDQRDERSNAREEHRFYNARSAEFHRGGRLPGEFRDRQYVVSDWRGHHLTAPPRGYHWVQVGPDYVLASVATGIIANLILSR